MLSSPAKPRGLDPRFFATAPPAGYWRDFTCGAWRSLPWPDDLEDLPPSLGWDIIEWAEQWLVHHITGEPWRFTKAQKRFLVLWYAVRPDGKWLYRRGVNRRAKGNGKSPLAAAVCLIEMFGPVVFDHFDELGNPIGKPHRWPLVQIAANSENQAKDVLAVANAMVSKRLKAAVGFDAGKNGSAAKSGGRLQILTQSVKSAEGDPATAIVFDEPHHATTSSGGKAMAAVCRRNVAKSPGGQARICEFTNAHEEAGDSVAEDTFNSWQNQVMGNAPAQDILYDSCEAPAYLSLHEPEEVRAGIRAAYADAPWIDPERIEADIYDTDTTMADAIRYYFNATAANETGWVDPNAWRTCARPMDVVEFGTQIALALDCSKNEDATALVAVRISDGHVITLGVWARPIGWPTKGPNARRWSVNRAEVDAKVRWAHQNFDVVAFYGDPSPVREDETEKSYWKAYFDAWHRDFAEDYAVKASSRNACEFDMRLSTPGGLDRIRRFTEEAMATVQAVDEDQSLTHDGDPALQMHVLRAHRRTNQFGFSLGKRTRDSKDLVDLAVAMVMARLARTDAIRSGKIKKKRSGVVFVQ
ncbi:hypothetical protein ACWEOE_10850 [Amycolatopsis sp. NPDC004368]